MTYVPLTHDSGNIKANRGTTFMSFKLNDANPIIIASDKKTIIVIKYS